MDIKLILFLMGINTHIFYLSFGALDSFTVNRIANIRHRLIRVKGGITFVQKDFNLALVDKMGNEISA